MLKAKELRKPTDFFVQYQHQSHHDYPKDKGMLSLWQMAHNCSSQGLRQEDPYPQKDLEATLQNKVQDKFSFISDKILPETSMLFLD